jgi:transcriptional regulator with XRE-family HTH domain
MKYSIIKTPNAVMEELVVKLRKLRKDAGVSQLELSERTGVSFGSIKRFETTGQISLESLLKIAYYFNRLEDFTPVFFNDTTMEKVARLFGTTNKVK